MGNRAVITFDKNPNSQSIGIYLHWNGGAESVLAFLEAANQLQVRVGDTPYEVARVVQIIGNFMGGTTSVGIGKLKQLDCDNGDNGLFAVSREDGKITIRQSKNGSITGFTDLDVEEIKKHPYWTTCEEKILDTVLARNKDAFKDKD